MTIPDSEILGLWESYKRMRANHDRDTAQAVAIEREAIAGFLATEGRRRLDEGQSASTDVSPLLTAAGFALNIMSAAIRSGEHVKP